MTALSIMNQALVRRAHTLMIMRGADDLISRKTHDAVVQELGRVLEEIRKTGFFPTEVDLEEAIRAYCEAAVARQF